MLVLALFFAVSCPETKKINKSNLPWNDFDRHEMSYCQKRCSKEYDDAPCLKSFFKLGFQDYYCECGKP
jgi:hypothetical protein